MLLNYKNLIILLGICTILFKPFKILGQSPKTEGLEKAIVSSKQLENSEKEIRELIQLYYKEDLKKGVDYAKLMLDSLECPKCACIKSAIFLDLGYGLGRTKELPEVIATLKEGIKMTFQCPSDTLRPYLYKDLAVQYGNFVVKDKKYIDSALLYMGLCLNEAPLKMNPNAILEAKITEVSVLSKAKQHQKALEKALVIKEKIDSISTNRNLKLALYDNLGSLYADTKDVDQAIKYFEKAVFLAQNLKKDNSITYYYHYLGYLYNLKALSASTKENKNDWLNKTIEIFYESLAFNKKRGSTKDILYAYQAIGNAQWKLQNIEAAFQIYEAGFELALEEQVKKYILETGASLAALLGEMGNHWQCIKILTNIQPYISSQSLDKQAYFFQTKAEAFQKTGQVKMALNSYEKAVALHKKNTLQKDSLFQIESIKQLKEFEVKFETQKKEQEILYRTAIEEKQKIQLKQRSIILFTLSVLLLGALIILYIVDQYRKQSDKKQKEILQMYQQLNNREEQLFIVNKKLRRFAHSLSHDILSKLDLILSNCQIAKTKGQNTQFLNNISDTSSWLKNYCLGLLNWSETGLKNNQTSNLKTVIEDILSSYDQKISQQSLLIKKKELDVTILIEEAPLKQILHNLIDNAIKYTKNINSPIISIYTELLDSKIKISIEDNGNTADLNELRNFLKKKPKGRHGLKIIQDTLEPLQQELIIEKGSLGGPCFSFLLPFVP